MAWFDGIFPYSEEDLNKEFPKTITPNLRLSEDGKKLAIINDYEEGTEFFELSDPKAEEDDYGQHVFIQAFTGTDADAAGRAVKYFLLNADTEEGNSVFLFRKDRERLFQYSFGHICSGLMEKQEELRSMIVSTPMGDDDVFVLPLKRFMHKCPVCGFRTLQYHNYFDICTECGWEDEAVWDEDEHSDTNDGYSIKEYREVYLQRKAEDPKYAWSEQFT